MIYSNKVIVKVIDAFTLLGKVKHQITFERKYRLKNPLSEDYKIISEQDHSETKQFLVHDLADDV